MISDKLKCPKCCYDFDENYNKFCEPGVSTSRICPKCSLTFLVDITKERLYITHADCEKNGRHHKWKYIKNSTTGEYKICRDCCKRINKPIQRPLFTIEV